MGGARAGRSGSRILWPGNDQDRGRADRGWAGGLVFESDFAMRRRILVSLGGLVVVGVVAAVMVATLSPASDSRRNQRATPPRSSATSRASPLSSAAPKDPGQGEGDLRRLLLPLPAGAEPIGADTGNSLSLEQAALGFGEGAPATMRDLGFRDSVYRAYLAQAGTFEVDVKLIRFSSAASASRFARRFVHEGPRVAVPGVVDATATRLDSASTESSSALVGTLHEGEVYVTVTVSGATSEGLGQLADVLRKQRDRLRRPR